MDLHEKRGLIKVYWADVRKRVAKIEPAFAKIADELNPDKSFPLYLAYYPYGAFDADTQSSFFPDGKGSYYRLTDTDAPKDVVNHLGYSKNNTPLAMVLDKQIESFIDLKNQGITIPSLIYTPGKMFPLTRILRKRNNYIYAPNGLLCSTAGVRSTFLLPNIGCATNHSNLQRDFNVQCPAPKSLYEHWQLFKEIISSDVINSDWRCCVMYFSNKWLEKIHNDKSWSDLRCYLQEMAWHQFEYEINRIHYDCIFSMIQQNRNLKPNPYLTDTAKHLFSTAIGATPGYIPALDDDALPLHILQKVFVESYGLKKYFPTIMKPSHFRFDKENLPIYYSLHLPATHVFSPKSRQVSSALLEMRELEHIMKIFLVELSRENSMCFDTIMGKVAKNVKFQFFHNKIDRHRIIQSSTHLEKHDKRFTDIHASLRENSATFASDAPFLRGCISISTMTSDQTKNSNNKADIPQ